MSFTKTSVTWSWRMLTWVARMSWYTPPCYFFHRLFFPCSYLIGGTIPTSLWVLVKNIFTSFVSVLFMECQLHIMKITSLILGTHESHACKLSLQACKHASISTHVQIWHFLIDYTAMHIQCVQLACSNVVSSVVTSLSYSTAFVCYSAGRRRNRRRIKIPHT